MKTLISSIVLVLALMVAASPGYSVDFSRILGGTGDQKFDTFKLIHVADLSSLMKNSKSDVHIYDANVESTREKFGIIPGARLLGSSDDYPLNVLPTDKRAKLVFYCANTQCMASHQAARRALKAGYKDVSVMADGIAGWKAAGEPTVHATASQASKS